MRKQALRAVATLSLLLSAAVSSAQAQTGHDVVVNIPFDFRIAGKVLPAGEYIVRRATRQSEGAIQVIRKAGGASVFAMTSSVEAGSAKGSSRLVFNRYGSRYFLSQVWTAGSSYGRELPKSGQERAVGREVAGGGAGRLTVTVSGRRP